MPGYVIHLCLAKEYANKREIKKIEDFFEGTIFPDGHPDKRITHYALNSSNDTNLYKFLQDKKIDTDFNKGWFLHLLADGLFYNKYFSGWKTMKSDMLYHDYDILNPDLIKKYELNYVPKGKEKYFNCDVKGETVEYHYDKVVQFIEEVSEYDLQDLANEIIKQKDFKFLYGL